MEDNAILERNTSAADDLPLFNRLFYILLPKNLDIKSNQWRTNKNCFLSDFIV